MTTPAVKDVPQLALGERVIEDGALMLAIEEARALKESHQGAQKVLKGLIEENGDYRGAFRVGRFKVTVTQRLSISITIPKPVKVKLPKAAKAKPLPETETVPMSVNGADGQPVRRQRRNGHGTPDELATRGEAKLAEMESWSKTPHDFVERTSDNQCDRCGGGREADAHQQETLSAAVERLIADAQRE